MKKLNAYLLFSASLMLGNANGAILTENLDFTASNQGMWGRGAGAVPIMTESSSSWSTSRRFGSITGSVSNVNIPAQYVKVPKWNPPSGWGCRERWLGECVWYGYKHSGYWSSKRQKIPGTGVSFVSDTRQGTEVRFNSSGHVSIQSDLGFNGGTIDAKLGYNTTILLPDNVKPGELFSIKGGSSLSSGQLSTQFPKLTGSISANFGVDISASATGCFLGAGCSSSTTTLAKMDTGKMKILDINTADLQDKMALFGLDQIAFDITKFPVNADLIVTPSGVPAVSLSVPGLTLNGIGVNLATVEVDYPDLRTEGALANAIIKANGTANNVLKLTADLDSIALLNGFPSPSGVVVNGGAWPASFSFRGDLLDLSAGPTMGITQKFGLESNLMVNLDFDRSIFADFGAGGIQRINSWSGRYEDMPQFMLGDLRSVKVSPTYWVDSWLSNTTSLNINASGFIDILKGDVTIGGVPVFSGVMSAKELDFPVTSVDVFNERFQIAGFDHVNGRSFVLQAVPEPASLMLFLLGLLGLALFQKDLRKQVVGKPKKGLGYRLSA